MNGEIVSCGPLSCGNSTATVALVVALLALGAMSKLVYLTKVKAPPLASEAEMEEKDEILEANL